jgi:serine-type D-Ala-D-Ala carboxypeptidase/endopeptidase
MIARPGSLDRRCGNGGTSGFRSFVGAARAIGTAVVVLSNTARSVDRLGLRLLKALPGSAG